MEGHSEQPPVAGTPETGDTRPTGMSRRSQAWIGMGAVALALVLLTMLSDSGIDPNAPPPSAGTGAAGETETVGLSVGQPAPLQFTLKDTNGVDVKLESFKGKVLIINFWATWCGPCKVEIPDLMALQDQYRDDVVVLGIDVLDEFSRVQAFANELKVNYPLLDGNDRKDVEEAYGPMWGLPTSVIVARDGTVHRKHAGIASKEQFQQYIESAL